MSDSNKSDDPALLTAVLKVIASTESLAVVAVDEAERAKAKATARSGRDWQQLAAKRVIRRYSNKTAALGAGTGALAVVPGVGTLVAGVGGASADTVMSLKWHGEMALVLAAIYGHDIESREVKERCLTLAGLGLLFDMDKSSIGSQIFVDMAQQRLQQFSHAALKQVFKAIAKRSGRKAVEKMAPFGIGMVMGGSINKINARLVGRRVLEYLQAEQRGELKRAAIDGPV